MADIVQKIIFVQESNFGKENVQPADLKKDYKLMINDYLSK